jgi:hypothetical protein
VWLEQLAKYNPEQDQAPCSVKQEPAVWTGLVLWISDQLLPPKSCLPCAASDEGHTSCRINPCTVQNFLDPTLQTIF